MYISIIHRIFFQGYLSFSCYISIEWFNHVGSAVVLTVTQRHVSQLWHLSLVLPFSISSRHTQIKQTQHISQYYKSINIQQ